jgi:(R,R)-butanediol dehydrogenase/meso-butanediol dehydrogenase/diacetyl reductase
MTGMMKAARLYGVGDLRIETVPRPSAPSESEVRLKVLAAGICGSDLHNFRTGQWISRAPSTPGHEIAGRILALGEGVSGFAIGDHVVADSRVGCGHCLACMEGQANLCLSLGYVGEVCDGGFAEELILPARLLLAVPKDLDPIVAAMAEPLAVALHAARRSGARAGEPALIAGCGPIGGLVALVLAKAGVGPILIADRNSARLELVAAVTGAVPVTLDKADIQRATQGAALRHAVEATGQTAVASALLDAVDNGATIALVGIFHGRLDLDPNRIVEREISLLGCSAFADELTDAVARLPEFAVDLIRFADAPIGLDAVPDAFDRLLAGQSESLKTVIVPV